MQNGKSKVPSLVRGTWMEDLELLGNQCQQELLLEQKKR